MSRANTYLMKDISSYEDTVMGTEGHSKLQSAWLVYIMPWVQSPAEPYISKCYLQQYVDSLTNQEQYNQ